MKTIYRLWILKHTGNDERVWGCSVTSCWFHSTIVRLSPKHLPFPFNPQDFPAAKIFLDFPYTQHLHVLNGYTHTQGMPVDLFLCLWRGLPPTLVYETGKQALLGVVSS